MALDSILSKPSEETYKIRKSVLAQYLMQCRKGYPSTKIQCPFDAFHVIDEEYFEVQINYINKTDRVDGIRTENIHFEIYNKQNL